MAELKYLTVFPSTKTQTINKLITENSLTRMINRLIDRNGYIITNEISKIVSEDIVEDIPLTTLTANNIPLEFDIRGYYFAVDSVTDITNILSWNPSGELNQWLFARIYIDKSVEGYPELVGQYDQTPITQPVTGQFTTGVTTITDFPGLKNISDVVLLDNNKIPISSVGGVTVSKEGKVSCTNFITGKNPSNVKHIQYTRLNYYTGIQVYSLKEDTGNGTGVMPAKPQPELPNGDAWDDTKYEYHDLLLIKYFKPVGSNERKSYIPLESIHKFTTTSISSVDGGEI